MNAAPAPSAVVLDIDNLVVGLGKNPRNERIIDGVSLQVSERETLCLVGESGSGKSVTSLTVMGLLQKGALVPSGGSIKLAGEEILAASDRRLRQLRATTMAMIFQEPMTALNPVFTVGDQIVETLLVHRQVERRAARAPRQAAPGCPSPMLHCYRAPHILPTPKSKVVKANATPYGTFSDSGLSSETSVPGI